MLEKLGYKEYFMRYPNVAGMYERGAIPNAEAPSLLRA
jgi:hypothetical protein